MTHRHDRTVFAFVVTLLTCTGASAAGDGDLCGNPIAFAACAGAAAADKPIDAVKNFWWNRARKALEADQFGDAERIAHDHPEHARVDQLLWLEVMRVLKTHADAGMQARRLACVDRLVAARPATWGATSSTQTLLVAVAERPEPEAGAMLQRLLDDGLAAPDTYRHSFDYTKVCSESESDSAAPCPRLVLLLDHGLATSPPSLAGLLGDTARAGRWADADYLLQRGADPNVEAIRNGIGVTTMSLMCRDIRDDSRRDKCLARRDDALRYFVAHGADPDGRPTPTRLCTTPLAIATDANDQRLVRLLQSLGADANAGDRCRATAAAETSVNTTPADSEPRQP